MIGRNDISVEELSFNDRSYTCVPPIKEVPEGVTQDEMIKVIMNNTLWRKKDLLALEEREPGSIEWMYLNKLRNNEVNRLDSGNPMGESEIKEGELTEKCWKGYTQKGMKTMFGKRYPNCVKNTKK
jgi:hypothetical protein